MKSKIVKTGVLMTSVIFVASFTLLSQKEPWPVPDKFVSMVNPVKSNAASISEGKTLWVQHCQSCHGKSGMGDGPKAAQLKTEPGDFSKAETQKQTDGSILYKVSEGRKDMPSFKKKLPDQEDIWNIVNYIRTLKK